MGKGKGIKIWFKNNKKWITYVLIAIIIGAYCYLFAFFTGDFIKRELTENGKYEILRDIFAILLAVIGIVGYAIYITMAKLVEARVKTYTETLHNRTWAAMKMQVGFSYWIDYKKKKHRNKKSKLNILRRNAIFNTKIAYQYSLKLDGENRDNEYVILLIKNNLAYYLAERKKLGEAEEGDDVFALELIQYVYDRIYKFPTLRGTYLDTYRFVKKQFKL